MLRNEKLSPTAAERNVCESGATGLATREILSIMSRLFLEDLLRSKN